MSTQWFCAMKTFIYFVFLSEVLNSCGLHMFDSSSADNGKTFLMKNKTTELLLKRSKRYLVFEKGAMLTLQGNIGKSIIPPAPRGLNVITEYTLSYELPSGFPVNKKKPTKTTSTTSLPDYSSHRDPVTIPYTHDYFFHMHPEYLTQRSYNYSKKKRCFNRKFDAYKRQHSAVCLSRTKRNEERIISTLTVSQRMLYDLIEKWSLLHGLLPRYCFMRTLCESSELLLPYGYSLLHDIIHILLRYTKPWTVHHKIFGHSLRQRYSIDECAKLYGVYCRVSWLDFITNMLHDGSRAADFIT